MKRTLSKFTSLIIAALMLFAFSATAFAADDELTINSNAKVKVGDTVKYTLYLSETTTHITCYEMRIFYDCDFLEIIPDSLTHDRFEGSFVANPETKGILAFSWADYSSDIQFAEKDVFLTVEFKVLRGGEATITQFVTDMASIQEDNTFQDITSYKWTYDISVNNKTITADQPAKTNNDSAIPKRQGGFVNYDDGMGENSPNNENHQPVTEVVTKVVENTRIEEVTRQGGGNTTAPILIAAAVVIVGAIVAILIVKRKSEGKKSSSDDKNITKD